MRGDKQPAKKSGLTWGRKQSKDGTLSYCLFRRDCENRVHQRRVTFGPGSARSRIARALRVECRVLREAVDDVQLAAWAVAA